MTVGQYRAMRIFRHRLSTRIWHWVNAVTLIVMMMTGLTISNAHPRLYWGQYGAWSDPAWLELPKFPGWMTIPTTYNLALARNWHLAFAWVFAFGLLIYFLVILFNGHARRSLTLPKVAEIGSEIKHHARLNFGDERFGYNGLQRLTYAFVLFGLLPMMIYTGLAMSPAMNAAWPWMLDLVGGRQSARSIHFIVASGLAAFVVLHIGLVIMVGPIRHLRAMVTGYLPLKKGTVS
jgi:thiosulfate reductase cytochrome b subunit